MAVPAQLEAVADFGTFRPWLDDCAVPDGAGGGSLQRIRKSPYFPLSLPLVARLTKSMISAKVVEDLTALGCAALRT
jgi:hypothetical protein